MSFHWAIPETEHVVALDEFFHVGAGDPYAFAITNSALYIATRHGALVEPSIRRIPREDLRDISVRRVRSVPAILGMKGELSSVTYILPTLFMAAFGDVGRKALVVSTSSQEYKWRQRLLSRTKDREAFRSAVRTILEACRAAGLPTGHLT